MNAYSLKFQLIFSIFICMEKNYFKERILPFLLAIIVIIVDQVSKMLIVKMLPIQPGTYMAMGPQFLGDFLRIIHIRNTGVAFSIGANWNDGVRRALFSIIPVLVLVGLIITMIKSSDYTKVQRWAISGIIGGGFGNIIDRIFRPDGVVDFIDVKFYGIFGMERWPTFNIADAAVVVCGIIVGISVIVYVINDTKTKKQN